jgi:Flp pilus assembly pilin Flp
LDDGLRERKQTTGARNHPEVGRGGLAICKPKHCRILALQMSARKTPRRVGLGRAAHIRHQDVAEWLLTEDYETACPGDCELWRAALASVPHPEARLCILGYFGHIPSVFYRQRFAFCVLRSGLEALPHERANQDECNPKAEVLKAAQERLGYKIITEKQALNRDFSTGGSMLQMLREAWSREEGQDIAEYAVMLAVILVIVIGTVRLIGTNSNSVFSGVASTMQ